MNQYTLYHLHSDLSNGVTNIDSTTKFGEYIEKAAECGMEAMAFTEHGSIFEWWHKKCAIENAGMKYIHGVEAYLTNNTEEKVRDNYHCVLLAKNYDGFLELNQLVTNSFNRKDWHFYYVPRISFEELFQTSENILITTACIGGVFGKADEKTQDRFLDFLEANKSRCFLEIGHHPDEKQFRYNKKLWEINQRTGIPLIAGTDTHVLNEKHEKGRKILQISKNIRFEDEENWDLKFKTYDELVCAYQRQNSVPEKVYLDAIQETNVMADMIKPFEIDCDTKYPHIYDNPDEYFAEKIQDAIKNHPYALKNHSEEELQKVVAEEYKVYQATKSIDFMLLQTYLREWEKKNGIQSGYGRGSVSGSMVAYLLGITQMDSLRFGLNFFRFMNPSRVTNADIDTDYSSEDRDKVKEFLLKSKLDLDNIMTAEIITFNTIALKGAVRDVVRGLYKKPDNSTDYLKISDEICKNIDLDGTREAEMRAKYPEVFDYVDIVNGTITSVGTHPSGVLISDLPIEKTIGFCSLSTTEYPVSMLNMKELDDLMYVKLDVLGLDNIGLINETCKLIGIDRLTPDNVDMSDVEVWKSIRDDTTLIFQWESDNAQQFLRKFMSNRTLEVAEARTPNFSMLKWLSLGNGLLRPACASFRDSVANGDFYDNHFAALNEFLAQESGRVVMQETIMRFLVKFCGYSDAESDNVRRAIAKKKGTETLLPEIKERFTSYCLQNYDITEENCEKIINEFLQVILDASDYAFSWNHSDAYSAVGYISGYLRYYYPLEFLTSALNIFGDNLDKTGSIIKYARKRGIDVTSPKWGESRGGYFYNRDKNIIVKGLASIKYMSTQVADELYEVSKSCEYTSFMDILKDLDEKTSLNSRQLDILIKLDFYSEFGNQRELLRMTEMFYDVFKCGNVKRIKKKNVEGTPLEDIIKKYAVGITKSGSNSESYTLLDVDSILYEVEQMIKNAGLQDLDDIIKVQNFCEAMGYMGYTSGKEGDRRKLYITGINPLRKKKTGEQFGYNVFTKSIGSGVESRFSLKNELYKQKPVKKGDIIWCEKYEKQYGYLDNRLYYNLTSYKLLS